MKKKILYKKIKKIFLPVLVFVSFFALCFSVIYANADTLIYQSNPFIIQGSATDNGESIADVTPTAFLFEKRGHSEVINTEIVDANGQYLYNIGRQQWDEEWEQGGISDGVPYTDITKIRCKNYIRVISNVNYYIYASNDVKPFFYDEQYNYIGTLSSTYNTTISIPSSAVYMKFHVVNQSTYNNDITISLYYEDEEGYDQYYPYEVVSYVDTGNEVLRSAGSVYDVKFPDGVIARNVGSLDLGSLTWNKSTGIDGSVIYFQAYLDDVKDPSSNSIIANIICSNYLTGTSTGVWSGIEQNVICVNIGHYLRISDTSLSSLDDASFKSAMNGIIINYELSTSTIEEGTSYSQNYYVDDFGSQYWLDHDMNYVEVGQAGLYAYTFDFVYSWGDNIFRIIADTIKGLGGNVLEFIKDGFVKIFCNTEIQEVDNVEVEVIIGPSEVSYYVAALLGISLLLGLCYYVVNMLRRSR